VAIYPALMAGLLVALAVLLARREPVLVEQERLVGANFSEVGEGIVETPIRLLVENRTESPRTFAVRGVGDVSVAGEPPRLEVGPVSAATMRFSVRTPAASFGQGSRHGNVVLVDDLGEEHPVDLSIMGPFNATGPRGGPR
jgi:hypothetical protein